MKCFVRIVVLCSLVLLLSGCCLRHSWQAADCEHPKTCEKCGKTEGEALGHDWEEATCEKPATCSRCGACQGEALGHDFSEWKLESTDFVNATEKFTKECTRCGAEQKEERQMETLYKDDEFLCTVEEFTARLQNQFNENFMGVNPELRRDSTADQAEYSVLIGDQAMGHIRFIDNNTANLRGDEENSKKFSVIMVQFDRGAGEEFEKAMSCIPDIIRACDPTQTADTSTDLGTTLVIMSSLGGGRPWQEERAGVRYIFGISNTESILGITCLH